MILNGKCKEEFIKWYGYNSIDLEGVEFDFNMENKLLKTSYIVEYFDSVGVYIVVDYGFVFDEWSFYIFNKEGEISNKTAFKTRQEATGQAIKKANEIYNENKTIKES